ncbi:hypothetical protein FRY98_25360 [Paenibacillus faecis]|uniref:Uncharacterized protein n=1 Tax=Paenibacillus faecis TaxID=862114 RepID=A0A5D0CKD8_9BACL|nr:hypothetical protein FRY98_25360 [Paenibacillus faecis]
MPVPSAPAGVTLPSTMRFGIDNRFSTAQRYRIQIMISGVLAFWNTHYTQRSSGARSSFQICANKYARFNLSPVWFTGRIANGAGAANVMMGGLTQQIVANGFNRAPRALIRYQVPSSTIPNFTVKAVNGTRPDTVSLSVTINPRVLNRTDLPNQTLFGSLFHAWLHRQGYRHPTGVYTSYMAGEAAMCVMRNNANKSPNVPDSIYTTFLD